MNYLVIGPANLDIQHHFSSHNPYTSQTVGGKGYNIAKNLAVFGPSVSLSTILGEDEVGTHLQNRINQDGITLTANSVSAPHSLIYTEVLDGNAQTLARDFTTKRFQYEQPPDVEWSTIDVCVVLSSTRESTLEVLAEVKAFHPQVTLILEFAGKHDNAKLASFLSLFDMIIGNEKEFHALAKDLNVNVSSRQAELFTSYGVLAIIETQGTRGISCTSAGSTQEIPSTPLSSEQIVSTIGAGDSVTATVAYLYYGCNYALQDALEKGMTVAREVIQQPEAYVKERPSILE
jgi:sugar/nucleoside kinase (ribokinase family)